MYVCMYVCMQGTYQESLDHFQQVLLIYSQDLPSTHPDIASAHCDVAVVLQLLGAYAKASSEFDAGSVDA